MKKTALSLVGSALLGFLSLTGTTTKAIAQSVTSPCQPPQPNEYLLFVASKTRESQEQMQRTLPKNTQFTLCRYLDETVTRIAGFRRMEDAQSWALYVQDIVGLPAYVIRPSSTRVSSNSPNRVPSNSSSLAYNPKPLGEGYAVLVDYFNKPEIAAQVQQILGGDVGLVSYGQRPYLLAMYTSSQRKASSTLRELSDRGFSSMVVDSRRVTLLRPIVSF